MHHGTCVTHVPWCMSGSLTCGDGENVPSIPGACAPAILRIWQEAHGIVTHVVRYIHRLIHRDHKNFADAYLENIFLSEMLLILIPISLEYVPKFPISNKSSLIRVTAQRRTDVRLIIEPTVTHTCVTKLHINNVNPLRYPVVHTTLLRVLKMSQKRPNLIQLYFHHPASFHQQSYIIYKRQLVYFNDYKVILKSRLTRTYYIYLAHVKMHILVNNTMKNTLRCLIFCVSFRLIDFFLPNIGF